jgi:glycosyltransferase involved in cell wall biosynthesis
MAENPAQAHEMGLKGRVRLCQKYSLRKHMDTLLSLYRELLDRP